MIKAPEGFNIHEEFDFYRQQAYRRYSRGGIDGVIVFLTELLQVNVLISRILKKQYREFMSDEQSQEYNNQYEQVLKLFRQVKTPEELALYTAAALLSRSRTAPNIVTESAYRAAESANFIKKYNTAFRNISQLDFLSPNDFVQFILFKFQIYNRKLRYDDLFNNYAPIIINPARKNQPLKTLVKQAVDEAEFKYLWFLTRILPNVTMEMADITEERLLEAGKSLTSNQYAHYINFCIRMWLRSSNVKKEKVKRLKDCCDRLCDVFSISQPQEIPYVRTMQLIGSIWLDYDNVMQYLDEYEYQPADPRDLVNDLLRDLTDQVFELLFQNRPSVVHTFIETLKDNNPYHYTDTRDFQFAARRANSTCKKWISDLCEHYDRPAVRDIFMNSNLRSCYPLSRFLAQLFKDKPGDRIDVLKFLADYIFTGQINKVKFKDSYEMVSYSFRNDNCRILLDVRKIRKNEALLSLLNDNKVKDVKNVKFVLQSFNITDDSDDFLTLKVLLPHDWQADSFLKTRAYRSDSRKKLKEDPLQPSEDLI